MGLGVSAQRLAAQPVPGPDPQTATDRGCVGPLTGFRALPPQPIVQPSASRRALWMAVAATAASAPATAIWFSPRTTSPAA